MTRRGTSQLQSFPRKRASVRHNRRQNISTCMRVTVIACAGRDFIRLSALGVGVLERSFVVTFPLSLSRKRSKCISSYHKTCLDAAKAVSEKNVYRDPILPVMTSDGFPDVFLSRQNQGKGEDP